MSLSPNRSAPAPSLITRQQRFEEYAGYDLEMIYDLTDGET
jgi:hypothetical protein